jgi:very-short-patch-repair endonuclease
MSDEKHTMHEGAFPQIFRNARALRKSTTLVEKILWTELLSNKKMLGYKFRRQHAFNRYILDFYCHELKLSLEIDGEIHDDRIQKEYDQMRTEHLIEFGITELRFKNSEVMGNIDEVKRIIMETIQKMKN